MNDFLVFALGVVVGYILNKLVRIAKWNGWFVRESQDDEVERLR
jgi:hypothetical protein